MASSLLAWAARMRQGMSRCPGGWPRRSLRTVMGLTPAARAIAW
jgi:hypothetical protein